MFRPSLAARATATLAILALAGLLVACSDLLNAPEDALKGYDATPTGLTPAYPETMTCSPLTSLYASWLDIDGTKRPKQHTGVDAGRLGDPILAPAPGTVKAVWRANWGWGEEGALLIEHTREDLNLTDGAAFYYSAFDHLKWAEIKAFEAGERIERGEELARVYRPGGVAKYLPEVHWEVWESDGNELNWTTNGYGGREWRLDGARLVDPLYMMSLETRPGPDFSVQIPAFTAGKDYRQFKGFTYILPCKKKA